MLYDVLKPIILTNIVHYIITKYNVSYQWRILLSYNFNREQILKNHNFIIFVYQFYDSNWNEDHFKYIYVYISIKYIVLFRYFELTEQE